MTPNDAKSLMHAEIDGANSPAESEALRRWLARDPSARERYDRLVTLTELLDGVPELEPPAELRPSILRSLSTSTTARSVARRPVRRGSELARRVGFAAAAAVVVGVLGYAVVDRGGIEPRPEEVRGTMGAGPSAIESIRAPISGGGASGVLQGSATAGTARVLADLRVAPDGLEAVLLYDESVLSLVEAAGVRGGTGQLRWTPEPIGSRSFTFARRSAATARVTLDIVRDGETVASSTIEIPAGRSGPREKEINFR